MLEHYFCLLPSPRSLMMGALALSQLPKLIGVLLTAALLKPTCRLFYQLVFLTTRFALHVFLHLEVLLCVFRHSVLRSGLLCLYFVCTVESTLLRLVLFPTQITTPRFLCSVSSNSLSKTWTPGKYVNDLSPEGIYAFIQFSGVLNTLPRIHALASLSWGQPLAVCFISVFVCVCVSLLYLYQCTSMRNSGANMDSSQQLLSKHIISHYHNIIIENSFVIIFPTFYKDILYYVDVFCPGDGSSTALCGTIVWLKQ